MKCNSTKECHMIWYFQIENFELLEEQKVEISVYGDGVHHHTSANPVRGNTRGEERQELMDRLENKSAAAVRRDLLAEKLSSDKGAADLEAGNYDHVPSAEALRQIMAEKRRKDDLDKDPWKDLKMRTTSINSEYGRNSVFTLSDTPFQVAWSTDNMLKHLYQLSKSTEVLIGHFDSTGSLLKPVEWDADRKAILVYSLVVKIRKQAPIPVAEMVSNDQHEDEIGLLFHRLLLRYQAYLQTTYGTKPKALPFKIVVVDMSWAMTNAVLSSVVGMSLISYLHACIKANADGVLIFVLVVWCFAHFLHGMKRRVAKYVPIHKKKYSPARRCLKFSMADMARTETIEDAVEIFKLIVLVFNSKYMTDKVDLALKALANRFSMSVDELKDAEAAHEFLEDESQNPEIPVYIPEEDRACSSLFETYEDSPFFKIFSAEAAKVDYGEELVPLTPNPFYIEPMLQYLLRYMLPFYPLWSRFVQGIPLPSEENPLTNSAVELSFKLDKEETWQRKKYHKAARFLHKTIEETEKRILESQFNVKAIRKNIKKPRVIIAESESREKKKEVWKKTSKRPLHGHHSKANTQAHGQKLYDKSEKLMNAIKVSSKLVKKSKAIARQHKQKAATGTEEKDIDFDKNPDEPGRLDDSKNVKMSAEDPAGSTGENEDSTNKKFCCDCQKGAAQQHCAACRKPLHSFCGFAGKDSSTCWSCFSNDSGRLPISSSINITVRKQNHCVLPKLGTDLAAPSCKNGHISEEEPQRGNEENKVLPWKHFFPSYPIFQGYDIQLLSQQMYCVAKSRLVKQDFSCLNPGEWLTDKIIDTFLDLVSSPATLKEPEARILNINSLALECVAMGLESILERAERGFMLFNDFWLVPSHVNRNHWILFLVLCKKKCIVILDPMESQSLSKDVLEQLQIIRHMIHKSHVQCLGEEPDWTQWRMFAPSDISDQSNAFDCGLYVCIGAYCVSTKTPVPTGICHHSEELRQWMIHELVSNATCIATETQGASSGEESDIDCDIVNDVYKEHDEKVAEGILVVNKPWKCLPLPNIPTCIDQDLGASTGHLLTNLLDNLWCATSNTCGANICKKSKKDMYFCEACREFYHLQCVNDLHPPEELSLHYLCPKHTLNKKSSKMASVGSRTIALPLRLRKSL